MRVVDLAVPGPAHGPAGPAGPVHPLGSAGDVARVVHDPVGYWSGWVWVATALVAVVVVWHVGVLWATRARPSPVPPTAPAPDRETLRREHLSRLETIPKAVAVGRLSHREGQQRISATLRSYVTEVGVVPARSMSQADLRAAGHDALADVVAGMYPPEFAADAEEDPVLAQQALLASVERARRVVSTW